MDNLLLVGFLDSDIALLKQFLNFSFIIKDMGHAHYFRRVELIQLPSGIHIHQHKYVCDLLRDAGLLGVCSTSTPLPKGLKFSTDLGPLL